MNIVKKIGIKGVGPFKEGAVLEIPKGISYLYGLNHMAGRNSNFAGKSVFASALGELLYEEPIIGLKQDRQRAGSRFVEYQQGPRTIRIAQSFNGRKEQLKITVDGENKSGRTTPLTRKLIPSLWAPTQTDYLTYGLIDSNLHHPLVRGSTADRKGFFTSFFGLDKLDAERRLFASELLKLKRVRAAHTELDKTFRTIKSDMLPKAEREGLGLRIKMLEERVKILRAKSDKAQNIKRLVEFESYGADQIKALAKICPDLDSFPDVLKDRRSRLKAALASVSQLEEWRDYRRAMVKYKAETQGLDMGRDADELKAASTAFVKARARYEALEPLRPSKVEAPTKPETDREDLIVKRAALRHKLDHARKFGKGVCDTCGQEVKVEPKELVEKKLRRVMASIKEWDEYEMAQEAFNEYEAEFKAYKAQVAEKAALKAKLTDLLADHALWTKRSRIVKPDRVEKPEAVEDPEPLRREVEVLEFCSSHVDTIRQLKNLTDEDRALDFDATKLNELQDRLSEMKTKLQVHNTVKSRALSIRNRLHELASELANEEPLELLVEAYSDKAIKKMVIEAISQHLMGLVNKYATLVFDNYVFEFVWGSQIQILVHRPSGTTDVRKLSGAESKLFTIVLVLALLAFVPKSKRMSLLILDEPTASFGAESTAMLHKLLPHLISIIPSVLVVTPKSDERFEGATELTVVRTREGARIVKGHPSQM